MAIELKAKASLNITSFSNSLRSLESRMSALNSMSFKGLETNFKEIKNLSDNISFDKLLKTDFDKVGAKLDAYAKKLKTFYGETKGMDMRPMQVTIPKALTSGDLDTSKLLAYSAALAQFSEDTKGLDLSKSRISLPDFNKLNFSTATADLELYSSALKKFSSDISELDPDKLSKLSRSLTLPKDFAGRLASINKAVNEADFSGINKLAEYAKTNAPHIKTLSESLNKFSNFNPKMLNRIGDMDKLIVRWQMLTRAIGKYTSAVIAAKKAGAAFHPVAPPNHKGGGIDAEAAKVKAEAKAAAAAAKEIERAAKDTDRASRVAGASMAATASHMGRMRSDMDDIARRLAMVGAGMLALPVGSVLAAAKVEKEFANVARTSAPEVRNNAEALSMLKTQLLDISSTSPISITEIMDIATAANQMGIATDKTASFSEAVAKFAATSGVDVEQVANAFGRFESLVPDVDGEFIKLSDAILKVGVNSVASEKEIIDVSTQISAIAAGAGMTKDEIVAMSGAMASVKISPELSRGVMTRSFGKIEKAIHKGGATLEAFARTSGLTAQQVRDQWGTDKTGEVFRKFLAGVSRDGSAALRAVGITASRDIPALMRLATAKAADGEPLYEKTLKDTQKSAGETAEQYKFMEETVSASFKRLGNNIVRFFDAVGNSSLGPIGGILNFLSDSFGNLARSMDEPIKLFGLFELPITPGHIIGLATAFTAAAGAVALLGGALAKVSAGMAAFRTLGQNIAQFGMGGTITGGKGKGKGIAVPGPTIVGGTGSGRKPAKIPNHAYPSSGYSQPIGPQKMSMAATGFAAGREYSKSFNHTVRTEMSNGINKLQNKTALSTPALGLLKIKDAAKGAGRAIANIGGFLAGAAFGPWGLAAMGAVTAIQMFTDANIKAGTSIEELHSRMAAVQKGDFKALDSVFRTYEKSGWGQTSRPFEDTGMEGFREQLEWLTNYRDNPKYVPTQEDIDSGNAMEIANAMNAKNEEKSKTLKATVGDFTKSLKNQFKSGDKAAAFDQFSQIVNSYKQYRALVDSGDDGKAIEAETKEFLRLNGVATDTESVYDALMHRNIKLNKAMYGVARGVGQIYKVFGDPKAMQTFMDDIDAAAASFIDFGSIIDKSVDKKTGEVSVGTFTAEMDLQITNQEKYISDMKVVGQHMSAGALQELAKLGPAGAPIMAKIAQELGDEAGGIGSSALMDSWEAGVEARSAGIGSELAQAMLAQSDLMELVGATYAQVLANSLTADQMTQLHAALATIPEEYRKSIARSIADGSVSFEEGMVLLQNIASAKSPEIPLILETLEAQQAFERVKRKIEAEVAKFGLDAIPDSAYQSTATLITYIKDQIAALELHAETKPAEAKVDGTAEKINNMKAFLDVVSKMDTSAVDKWNAPKKNGTVSYKAHFDTLVAPTIYGTASYTKNIMQKDGGIVDYFANGGVRQESHTAQIAPAGAMRVWAEPETGGEAYIPLSPTKRKRSEAILANVANRFGYALASNRDVRRYADGGEYHAQQTSRMYNSSRNNVPNTRRGGGVEIGSVTFTQPEQRDQFREFSRTLRTVAREV